MVLRARDIRMTGVATDAPVDHGSQTRVPTANAAHANQKWLPWTTGSSWRPASGPSVARP